MLNRVLGGLVCFASVASAGAQGIATQAEMHARVVGLYSFSPHTLTDAQRSEKSVALDRFWSEVKERKEQTLPLLRAELRNESDPAFFMSDGSALLLSVSTDTSDKGLAAEAVSRCDLADVVPAPYFYEVHGLSMAGVDTTRASLHILDDPKFVVSVPQHAMVLDQGQALVYLLLPVKEDLWMASAKERFASAKDDDTKKSLLTLFFYSQTAEGDRALQGAAADGSQSATVRQEAKLHLEHERQAVSMKTGVTGSESEVREARRKRMGAVSDEAVDDLQVMTVRLIQLRKQARDSRK